MATNLNNPEVWATADEIRFIQRTTVKGMSKLEFLTNYKEGLCNRKKWDSINKRKLMQALNLEIKKEKGDL